MSNSRTRISAFPAEAVIVKHLRRDVGEALNWATTRTRRLARLTRDNIPDRFDTFVHAAEAEIRSALDEPSGWSQAEKLWFAICDVLKTSAIRDALEREAAKQLARLDRKYRGNVSYTDVRARLELLSARHPMLPALVVLPWRERTKNEVGDHPFVRDAREIVRSIAPLVEYRRTRRRERRAALLMDALERICDGPYKRYLQLLWSLDHVERCAACGAAPIDLGKLLQHTAGAYPTLVDPDVNLFRKAAAHQHWRYVPERNAIQMWEISYRTRAIQREEEFPIADLQRRAEGLLQIGGQVRAALIAAVVGDLGVHRGLFRTALEALAMVGEAPTKIIESMVAANLRDQLHLDTLRREVAMLFEPQARARQGEPDEP